MIIRGSGLLLPSFREKKKRNFCITEGNSVAPSEQKGRHCFSSSISHMLGSWQVGIITMHPILLVRKLRQLAALDSTQAPFTELGCKTNMDQGNPCL